MSFIRWLIRHARATSVFYFYLNFEAINEINMLFLNEKYN